MGELEGKSVLIVGHAVQYGGAEVYIVDIIEELKNVGACVTVLWCNEDIPIKLKQQFEALDVNVIYQRFGVWSPDSLFYNRRFSKVLESIDCDIIFFNRTGGWGKYSDLIPTAKLKKRVPMVCVEHFHPPKFPIRWREPFRTLRNLVYCRFQARLFDRVICMNDAAKSQFSSLGYGYKADSLYRVYNGIDTDRYVFDEAAASVARQSLGLKNESITLFSGRLSSEKGPDVLLKAWSILPESQRLTRKLVLVGEGGMESELRSLAASLGILDSVIFAGFQKDILPYLCAAELVVMPSREESFGISLAEALSVGRYAVATNVGGIPELVKGVAGVELVDPDSPAQLAQGIGRQLELVEQRGPENFDATAHMKTHFSVRGMRNQTIKLLAVE